MSDLEKKQWKIEVRGGWKLPLLRELADEFMPPEDYVMEEEGRLEDPDLIIDPDRKMDREQVNRQLFDALTRLTGKRPAWGTLTGVRPVKLAGEMFQALGSWDRVEDTLMGERYLTREKADLIIDIARRQEEWAGQAPADSIGIYIGIPFCPTRCLYCSFASNQVPDEEIARYLPALFQEIRYCGRKMAEQGLWAESVYVGGGTPTTLNETQTAQLMAEIHRAFPLDRCREFSVEAGRPDTISREKLQVLKDAGVGRISINPQSMKQETLDRIGRSHRPEDIERAFGDADAIGFPVINADLIAGLPGEIPADFAFTLDRVLALGANNITTHTLAVKRASRLIGLDKNYHYRAAGTVGQMLRESRARLDAEGFLPYYLYRQKHMAGNFENTGYCLPDTEGLYNTRIMDEHQSILALGAGGISKRYEPASNKLTRTPNVTNYQQYILRVDEMCQRKEETFFVDDCSR